MDSSRSNADPGYCGGVRVEPLQENDGCGEDRWMSPPPDLFICQVQRIKGGIQNAATKGPERKATLRGLTGTSSLPWPIVEAFRGGDMRNIHIGDVW